MWRYYKVPNSTGYQLESHPQAMAILAEHEITQEQYDAEVTAIKAHSAALKEYVKQVRSGEITLDDVPEEYKAEVEATISQPEPDPPNNDYGVANEVYNAIIDDYTLSLMDSGVL